MAADLVGDPLWVLFRVVLEFDFEKQIGTAHGCYVWGAEAAAKTARRFSCFLILILKEWPVRFARRGARAAFVPECGATSARSAAEPSGR